MKLSLIIELAKQDGYTHANDTYSYHGKKITNIKANDDMNEYEYRNGEAIQVSPYPSNHYTFYKHPSYFVGVDGLVHPISQLVYH